MARARNIKPSFFQNEEIGELDPIARLAFIGMWTIADFKGCIEWRPKRIKIQILPYDNCNLDKIGTALEKSGVVRFYSVGGIRYLKILNFEKHQNPHKNERETGSDIPDINENSMLDNIENNPEENGTPPADSLLLNPDSPIPQSEFEEFWSAYPKKKNKDAAKKAWKKKNPPLKEILEALEWQCKSQDWKKERGQFIPYPASYLNAGGWMDEKPSDSKPLNGKPWFLTGSGIEAKVKEVNFDTQGQVMAQYKHRLFKMLGITPEIEKQALADYG